MDPGAVEVGTLAFVFGIFVGSALERTRGWRASVPREPYLAGLEPPPRPQAFDGCALAAEGRRFACFGCGDLEVAAGRLRHADTCPEFPGMAVPIADVARQAKPVPEVDTSTWPDWP